MSGPSGKNPPESGLLPLLVTMMVTAGMFFCSAGLCRSEDSMMADSPVQFPDKGALPARFPPDVPVRQFPAEDGYYLFESPPRSPAQIRAIQAGMPTVDMGIVPSDWVMLPETQKKLTRGQDVHILGLGDSIVNDTFRSGWVASLREEYPDARISSTVLVRGSGGCRHYLQDDRIQRYLVPMAPDLVFIGGISQQGDLESIRKTVEQIRMALPECEFILATGAFGTTDPRDQSAIEQCPYSGTSTYGRGLQQLAIEQGCAFLDMTTPWATAIRSSGVHPHRFYRDRVHANEFGEQILNLILMAFFRAD